MEITFCLGIHVCSSSVLLHGFYGVVWPTDLGLEGLTIIQPWVAYNYVGCVPDNKICPSNKLAFTCLPVVGRHSCRQAVQLSGWHHADLCHCFAQPAPRFRTPEWIACVFCVIYTFWWRCISLNLQKIKHFFYFLMAALSEWLDLSRIFFLRFCPVIR